MMKHLDLKSWGANLEKSLEFSQKERCEAPSKDHIRIVKIYRSLFGISVLVLGVISSQVFVINTKSFCFDKID